MYFTLCTKKISIEPAINHKIDTDIFVSLPQNSKGLLHQDLKVTKLMKF